MCLQSVQPQKSEGQGKRGSTKKRKIECHIIKTKAKLEYEF